MGEVQIRLFSCCTCWCEYSDHRDVEVVSGEVACSLATQVLRRVRLAFHLRSYVSERERRKLMNECR